MKLFQSVAAAFQLAGALAHREFKLTREHNGACLKVDSVGPNTTITLDFSATDSYYRTEIPVIVFEYAELEQVKNVPQFVEFLNETYTNKEEDSAIVAYGERVRFNLLPREEGAELPPSFAFAPAVVFGEYDNLDFEPEPEDNVAPPFLSYPVKKEGVYCVYLPRYIWQQENGDLNLFPRSFDAHVSVNNEPLPVGVEEEVLLNSKIAGGLGLVTMLMYFYHSGSETPIIANLLLSVFALNFVYFLGFFLLYLSILLGAPKDFVLQLIENYTRLENTVIDTFSRMVVFAIYVGHGVIYDYNLNFAGIHSGFTAPKWTYRIVSILVVSYVVTLLANHILVHKHNPEVVAANINKLGFEVLARSIILKSSYHFDVVSRALKSKTNLIYGFSIANMSVNLISFIYSVYKSIAIVRQIGRNSKSEDSSYLTKDKRRDDKSYLSKPLKRSLVLHLFIYKLVVMPALFNLFLQPISFFGQFDIAECLNRIHPIISRAGISKRTIVFSEFLLLWLIWGYGEYGSKESDILEQEAVEKVEDSKTPESSKEDKDAKDAKNIADDVEVEVLEENKGVEAKD